MKVFRNPAWRAASALLDAAGSCLPRVSGAPRGGARRIFVFRPDALGDLLLSVPALRLLRASCPRDHITLAVARPFADLARGLAPVDEVVPLDLAWFSSGPRPLVAGWGGLLRLLRRGRYDAAIDLRGDLRAIAAIRLAGIPVRIALTGTGGGPFLTRAVPWRGGTHASERDVGVVRTFAPDAAVGAPVPEPLAIPPAWREEGCRTLRGAGVEPDAAYLVVCPGAGTTAKLWGAVRIARAASFLRDRRGWAVLVMGGPGEEALAQEVVAGVPGAVSLAGRTTLPALAGVLALARCVLSNDSGPSHLSALLGTPTVVVFSGTCRPEEWAPRGGRVAILSHAVPCAPCFLRECNVDGHPCLSGIETERVVEAAMRLAVG